MHPTTTLAALRDFCVEHVGADLWDSCYYGQCDYGYVDGTYGTILDDGTCGGWKNFLR
ncbi:hypothetical protein ACH4U7_24495 [Streptomyces sp. NPDC020845]|uniref:hypothetical protein n=1 Tax=Streptomyces sp. NPDC020845 TaxID=3365096 RepID=UPI003797BDAA